MADEPAPVVHVDLYQVPAKNPLGRPTRRPQRWRWRAVNAGNNRVLAVSSAAYTNADDAIDAIDQLFAARTDVWIRREGQLLRIAGNE